MALAMLYREIIDSCRQLPACISNVHRAMVSQRTTQPGCTNFILLLLVRLDAQAKYMEYRDR